MSWWGRLFRPMLDDLQKSEQAPTFPSYPGGHAIRAQVDPEILAERDLDRLGEFRRGDLLDDEDERGAA